MASTFSSAKVASGVQAKAGIGLHVITAEYEAASALVVNDVIQMVKIPAGATVVGVILSVDDLDSGTAIVLAVGDDGAAGRFISGSTIGQGGGTVRLGDGITGAAAAAALNHKYTDENTIDIKVTTAPAGGGTGTLRLAVVYAMDE